jgi:type IV pilus assembly protein PilB
LIRRKLGEILVEMGAITPERLSQAMSEMPPTKRIGDCLVERGLVTRAEVTEALALQFGVPFRTLREVSFEPEAVGLIPEQVARRYQVVPVRVRGDLLTIAGADPLNIMVLDDVGFLTGLQVEQILMPPDDIERAIERVYVRGEFFAPNRPPSAGEAAATASETASDSAPIVRLVDSLLGQAIADNASDIHIEPQRDHLRIRYRIDGVLHDVNHLNMEAHPSLVTRLKVMAGLDISERRLPLDGAIRYAHQGLSLDLRVSTMPTVHGEKVVIRLFDPRRSLLTMDDIGLSPRQQELFQLMLDRPYGLIAVCGPTGCGKTTTLHVMLQQLNDTALNIMTIEDPVEAQLEGVNHIQVNPRVGLGFANVLRSALRQDPDVIMVGETRDAETADIAVRAALTGHKVLTSMHTNDAPGAITRLLDMGIEPFLVASSVSGVVAQRLVRRLCPHCARPVTYSPNSPEAVALGLEPGESLQAFTAGSCSHCHHSGYRGRVAIFEMMLVTEEMRGLVAQRAPLAEIRQLAVKNGMQSLRLDGLGKIRAGVTSVAEVLRATFQD